MGARFRKRSKFGYHLRFPLFCFLKANVDRGTCRQNVSGAAAGGVPWGAGLGDFGCWASGLEL